MRDEEHTPALRSWFGRGELVGCDLLRTEARRATATDAAALARVDGLLRRATLLALTTRHFDAAGRLPGRVRSLDALHVVAAMDLGEDLAGFVTYDDRQADAARAAGMTVVAPT